MIKSRSLALAALASFAPSAALALPQNCGELPGGPAGLIAYLKSGGATPGAIEVLICTRAYECNPVFAVPTTAHLAVGWQAGALVLAADADAQPLGARPPSGGAKLPEIRTVPWSARGAVKEVTWLAYDSSKCSVPPPIG